MKWFFLTFVILMGTLVNIAVMSNEPLSKTAAIAALNIAIVGLILIWYGAYFEGNTINAKCKSIGAAFLVIAAGAFILQAGINAALANSCEGLLSSRSHRVRNDILSFFQLHGYCTEIGYVVVLAGSCLMYVGTKLFFRIHRGFR